MIYAVQERIFCYAEAVGLADIIDIQVLEIVQPDSGMCE